MNADFLTAVEELNTATAAFKKGEIKPVQYADVRGASIAKALVAMAASFGCKLQQPLHIDSLGEFHLVAVKDDLSTFNHDYGTFGEEFAKLLTQYRVRTGVIWGAVMEARSSWCKMNHFSAEQMVLAFAASLEKQTSAVH